METFSVLLALCVGNSSVTGKFPSQRPVTQSFDVFFDLRLNKGWASNREAGDLRCHRAHYDVIVMRNACLAFSSEPLPKTWIYKISWIYDSGEARGQKTLMFHKLSNSPGVGVTKPISSLPQFSEFFSIVKTHLRYWMPRLYLTYVVAAQLWSHLSNTNVIQII